MTKKFEDTLNKYLTNFMNERRGSTYDPSELSSQIFNQIQRLTHEWERKNIGTKGWDYPEQRSEFFLELAEHLENYVSGMKRAAKQDTRKWS